MADGSYKVTKHEFSPKHGTARRTGEREKPTKAATWGGQPATVIPDLPDSAVEPVELERIPAEPVSGLELTADQKWQALDEVTRSQVEKLHQEHQERELEVKSLEAQAGMFARFFNKRLKEAQRVLAETQYKLEHPRYKQATEIYRQVQTEPVAPQSKVQEMIAQRDQLRQEIEEISYSFLKRYLGEGRVKAKKLQELEYKLQHPMYRGEVEKLKGQQEAENEEEFFGGPENFYNRYTEYDLIQNFQRLEREKKTAKDQKELNNIDQQLEKIKEEMAKRNMPDVDYTTPGALERVKAAKASTETRIRKSQRSVMAGLKIGEEIPSPRKIDSRYAAEPELVIPVEEDENEDDMAFDFSDEDTDPRIETEAGLEEKTKLEGWLKLAGIDPEIINQPKDITSFKKFLLAQIKATDDPGRIRALEESLKAWENYSQAKFGQKIERAVLPVPSPEDWAQEVKKLRAEAEKGEKSTAIKKEITTLTGQLDDLRLTPEIGSKLEQLGNFIRDDEYNQANQLMNEIRDIIIGLKPDGKNLTAIQLFNDLRKQLLKWQDNQS